MFALGASKGGSSRSSVVARAKPQRLAKPAKAAAAAQMGSRIVPTKDFTRPDGSVVQVLKNDYGFRSGANRLYEDNYGEVPDGIFALALQNFDEEWQNMRRMFVKDGFDPIFAKKDTSNPVAKAQVWLGSKLVSGFKAADNALVNANALTPVDELPETIKQDRRCLTDAEVRAKLQELKLDAQAVVATERERFAKNPPNAPWWIRGPYFALCLVLDLVYEGRPIQRFWVLEEVARMPYFAYLSMLHLYESLGWWRAGAALRRVHFSEEWNELHHLQIMEALGGDNAWFDRFVAQHSAIVYFWVVVVIYALSPRRAYQFSELVEGHATDTYVVFTKQNEELLASIPPPKVAAEYYTGADMMLFLDFQVTPEARCRTPKCENMLDVFNNIIEDETEHKATMVACQNPQVVAQQIADAKDVSCDVPASDPATK